MIDMIGRWIVARECVEHERLFQDRKEVEEVQGQAVQGPRTTTTMIR